MDRARPHKRLDDKSRMKREFHVRFCGSAGGRVPARATGPLLRFVASFYQGFEIATPKALLVDILQKLILFE